MNQFSTYKYYPFGMLMPNRHAQQASGDYRFGFNGKESDDEVRGQENSYNYGFRMLDPRIGRFLSIDPLTNDFPFYTPYQFAGNKPTIAIDLEGLEEFIVIGEPGTNIAANNTNTANVMAALANQRVTNGAPANLANVQQVPNGQTVNVQTALILWDPTARERGEGGMIQYQNVNGIGNQMRAMTPQEQAFAYISQKLSISSDSDDFARVLEEMDKRIAPDGTDANGTTDVSQGNTSARVNGLGEGILFVVTTPPPAVNLNTVFQPNTAVIANPAQVNAQLAPLANVLNTRAGSSVMLTGNVNVAGANANTMLGIGITAGQLATARATAVSNLLVNNFAVNPNQIQTAVGNVQGANGMAVQGQAVIPGNPPNNGNRIDLNAGN